MVMTSKTKHNEAMIIIVHMKNGDSVQTKDISINCVYHTFEVEN